MMRLFIEPVDVWLFRDGKPFDSGSDHFARSLFPPAPSVMQGAIRSHHLVVRGVDLRDGKKIVETVGTVDDYGQLRMRGPFLAKRRADGSVKCYFPVPADAAPFSETELKAVSARPAPDNVKTSVSGELPLLLWPHDREPEKKEFGSWLMEDELMRCLEGEAVKPIKGECLYGSERRYGIGRDDARRTTKEGALFEAEFVRPCPDVGLYVEVDGYGEWPDKTGLMRMGGEGRGGRFEQVSVASLPLIPKELPRRFRVYFATPTYFTGGWRPMKGWSEFFAGEVKLMTAAIHGYQVIGGFDWASGQQKAARRYVPAGSVYYFSHDGSARLKQDAITDTGAEIGFGQIIVTEWKEQ